MFELRDYRPADLAAVHAINEGEVPAVGTETAEAMAQLADWSIIAPVAVAADGAIAGFAYVLPPGLPYRSQNYRWFSARYDDFVYLDRVAISPRFQRQGLGRRLYAEVERLAAERRPSAPVFLLEVNLRPRNDTSLAFHAELGFVEVGQQETGPDDAPADSPARKLVTLLAKSLPASV